MTDKYQQLGDLLKAYTQQTTESSQIQSQPVPAAIYDQQAFGAYLSAAIDNSTLTRAQIVQTAEISEVTLYGLARGLIPAADIDHNTLHRLASTLSEDVAIFKLLLEGRHSGQSLKDVENSEILTNQARLTMSTERPPIPMNEEQDSSSDRPKRWFMMPKIIRPSIALGGVAAAILAVVILNSGLINQSEEYIYTSGRPLSVSPLSAPRSNSHQNSQTGTNASVVAIPTLPPVPVAEVTATPVPAIAANVQIVASNASNAKVVFEAESSADGQVTSLEISDSLAAAAPRTQDSIGAAAYGSNSNNLTDLAGNTDAESAPDSSPQDLFGATDEHEQIESAEVLITSSPLPYPTPTPLPTATVVPPVQRPMTFIDYGINAFTDTAADNLSTFSVDVDTGSYTIARRYLNDGRLPPSEAIRVEEFVNYFDYGYEQPAEDDVFAIHVDSYPSPFTERRIRNDEAGDVQLMRIGIQGYDIVESQRPDVALTFVIDVSGSMRDGGRLTLVKRSLTMLVEQLRPSDTIGIVVYSNEARVLLQPTTVSNANAILDAIFKLQPENSTNVAAGLNLGYDMAWRNFDERAINRVILASDGVANVGATGPGSIWEQVSQYADRGITLTSIGVGMGNYNDVIMEQLADMGDGVYGYVDTIEEAERLFVDELTGTLVTIAKDAKVQVGFNAEAVVRYRLLGYENRDVADADFRNDAVDAGEIGAGHSVTALYEVELAPAARGELAIVNLRWQDVDSSEVTEINQLAMVSGNEVAFEDAPVNFQLAAVVAEFAESLRNSLYVDEQMRNQEISEELRWRAIQVVSTMEGDEDVMELFDLISQTERLAAP